MATKRKDFVHDLCSILENRDHISCKDIGIKRKDFHGETIAEFENFLLDQGIVGRAELLEALQEHYGVPAIDVMGVFFEHHLVHMFPRDVMLRHAFIPYKHDGEVLFVIAHNPANEDLYEIIGQFVSYDIELLVGIERDICEMVKEFSDDSVTELQPDLDPTEEEMAEREARNKFEETE